MADWPDLEELKRRLDVTSEDFDGEASGDDNATDLSRLLAAAIAETKARIGNWDELVDEPDEGIAQSALELACEYAMSAPDPRPTPRSVQLLYGKRRRFGTA